MWRYTAERYRSNPVVVGYDLMCEPNSNEILDEWDQDEFDAAYGGSLYDWNAWYPNIVTAIREVDRETPILVGGNGYSALDWLPYLEPIERIALCIPFTSTRLSCTHIRSRVKSTLILVRSIPIMMGRRMPSIEAWLEDFLSTSSDYADEHDAVVAVNEYGAVRWGGGCRFHARRDGAL